MKNAEQIRYSNLLDIVPASNYKSFDLSLLPIESQIKSMNHTRVAAKPSFTFFPLWGILVSLVLTISWTSQIEIGVTNLFFIISIFPIIYGGLAFHKPLTTALSLVAIITLFLLRFFNLLTVF